MSVAPARSSLVLPKLMIVLALATLFVSACAHGPFTPSPPPPRFSSDLFLVANLSGEVAGFSDASGHLQPVPGSSAKFSFPLFALSADPDGTFAATLSGSPLAVSSLQVATIGAGGKLTSGVSTTSVTAGNGIAISSQGLIAATDSTDKTVNLLALQDGQLMAGASVSSGHFPQDLAFSGDGKFLYVSDGTDGSISVFSVASLSSLQLIQTAQLPIAVGEFSPSLVRVRLSDAGDKIAASTLDGRLFLAEVSPATHMISNAIEINVASPANLEEVIFDPTGQTVYTVDADNGGIYAFRSLNGGVIPLPGFPVATPRGIFSMAINSSSNHIYVVFSPLSTIVTYARDTQTGAVTSTGESVPSGGLLAGRIVRVPLH
jgi:DNA-binding beta-propeller fold protein YncE